jgi:hypothetical protein
MRPVDVEATGNRLRSAPAAHRRRAGRCWITAWFPAAEVTGPTEADGFRWWIPSHPHTRPTSLEEIVMPATYTFDVFSSLDGYGSYDSPGDWGGYWGKQGPELLEHRLALYGEEQRMVFGATTYRQLVAMLASSTEASDVRDPWVTRMRELPATVVSTTLEGPSTGRTPPS